MTKPADFADLADRYGGERYADGKADGRVQGAADRQSEVETLTRDRDAARADVAALQALVDQARAERDTAVAALAEHMATHAPSVPDLGPLEYADLDAYLAANPRAPQDKALYVPCPAGVDLESAFMALPSDQHMLVIGRDQVVPLVTDDGFRAAGVSSVLGDDDKRLPVVSTYKGKAARGWFAMARARRGIIGLSKTSIVRPTKSAFRQAAQIPDKGSAMPGGRTSPGRFFWTTAGVQGHELRGAQEKLIESNHPDPYFGNFTVEGADFGGVAYHALTAKGGTFERLGLDAAWRGFSGVPNGETAAISITGGRYLISRCATSPVDAQGRRVGSSPIMANRSPGGLWEHGDASCARAGMPTYWASTGVHDWVDIVSRWGGPGVNLEQCGDGFELRWNGGICWPNRGGKGGHPAPDGVPAGNSLHVHLHALGRATVTLTDVDLDDNVQPGKLCVQLYGSETDPKKVKVTATQGGKPVPVAAYGKGGVVALGT